MKFRILIYVSERDYETRQTVAFELCFIKQWPSQFVTNTKNARKFVVGHFGV